MFIGDAPFFSKPLVIFPLTIIGLVIATVGIVNDFGSAINNFTRYVIIPFKNDLNRNIVDKLSCMQLFVKVVENGSFSGAAKETGTSRSVVTKHVMWLEDNLGVRLLNRSTRKLNLTQVGTFYYDRCLEILVELEETDSEATQLHQEARGTLTINAPPYFGTYFLTPIITAYTINYPRVHFNLVLNSSVVDVIESGIDIAFRFGELSDSSLVAQKVARTKMVVCGSPAYLKQSGYPKVPENLQHHNCLVNFGLPPRNTWNFRRDTWDTAIKVNGNFEASTADAVRTAAIAGMGLANLPLYMIRNDLEVGNLIAILKESEWPATNIYVVYPHRIHLSAKVKTFLDFLRQHIKAHPILE